MVSSVFFLDRAVLLYGPRKAGTSLLHNLLDGGSELLMLPGELKLNNMAMTREKQPSSAFARQYLQAGRLDFRTLLQFDDADKKLLESSQCMQHCDDFCFEGLTKAQTHELFDLENYVRQLRAMLREQASDHGDLIRRDVAAFSTSLRGKFSETHSCWAAKDVGGQPARVVAFYREHFPQGKIIFITREPLFVVRSIVIDRRRKGIHLTPRAIWHECVKTQKVINFIAARRQESLPNEIYVTYERLTRDTEGEMRRLAAFLQIPFEPILCEPTTLGVPVVVRTASQKTTKVFQQVPEWTKDLTSAQVAAMKLFQWLAPTRFKRQEQPFVRYTDLLSKLDEAREQDNLELNKSRISREKYAFGQKL